MADIKAQVRGFVATVSAPRGSGSKSRLEHLWTAAKATRNSPAGGRDECVERAAVVVVVVVEEEEGDLTGTKWVIFMISLATNCRVAIGAAKMQEPAPFLLCVPVGISARSSNRLPTARSGRCR